MYSGNWRKTSFLSIPQVCLEGEFPSENEYCVAKFSGTGGGQNLQRRVT